MQTLQHHRRRAHSGTRCPSSALRAKWHCGALLFDIKGFFDNVHKDRLAAIMANLGFLSGMVQWALSFLSERRVVLSFNGEENAERDQPVGTPQGSPVSPVLSAIYTSPLLCKPRAADGCTLGMYVDDGIIFAQGRDWDTVTEALKAQYVICEEWLVRNNLAIEPEKTELIFFRSPRAKKNLPPDRLTIPANATSPSYRVNPKPTMWYWGSSSTTSSIGSHTWRSCAIVHVHPSKRYRSWEAHTAGCQWPIGD
jgi:hypothetical protein